MSDESKNGNESLVQAIVTLVILGIIIYGLYRLGKLIFKGVKYLAIYTYQKIQQKRLAYKKIQ
jgi:hypothetical protein